jgi:hypothetical protein
VRRTIRIVANDSVPWPRSVHLCQARRLSGSNCGLANIMTTPKERPDPIADYIEWSNNRYNPGHYLGGNIPPYLRKSSLGPRARRLAGLSLAISATMGIVSIIAMLPWADDWSAAELVLEVAVIALIAWAAVAMMRPDKRLRTPRKSRRGETH